MVQACVALVMVPGLVKPGPVQEQATQSKNTPLAQYNTMMENLNKNSKMKLMVVSNDNEISSPDVNQDFMQYFGALFSSLVTLSLD